MIVHAGYWKVKKMLKKIVSVRSLDTIDIRYTFCLHFLRERNKKRQYFKFTKTECNLSLINERVCSRKIFGQARRKSEISV